MFFYEKNVLLWYLTGVKNTILRWQNTKKTFRNTLNIMKKVATMPTISLIP